MKIPEFLKGNVNLKLGKKNLELSKKIVAIILVIVIALLIILISLLSGSDKASAELVTAQVTRGNIVSSIEGTGVIEAINQYEITSLAKGDIIADYFEEGDYVEKDQLLYEMDASSVTSSIERAQSNYEKAQMNYENAVEDVENLNIKSDISGVITSINIKKGDQVGNNTVVAQITDRDALLLKIPFISEDAKNLYTGQSARVDLESSFTTLDGKITRIATGSVLNSYGVPVTNVEIELKNPGSVMPGDRATAVVGNYACNDAGTIEYKNESTILSKVSGKVSYINCFEGDRVYPGTVIARLESDSVNSSARSNSLSLKDALSSLKDAEENLDDYSIRAPISGKVIEKNAKAGEKLDTNSSSTMAIIADLSSLVFEMSIDELDISKIKVGQEVNITADAVENKMFKGTVTSVSIVGSSSQGVTSYPVKVTIEDGENSGLIPGMNVTGNIIVETVENVVRVPVSAVRRGNFVIVKDDGTVSKNQKSSQNSDDGAKIDRENFNSEKMPNRDMTQGERPQGEMPNRDITQGEGPQGEIPNRDMIQDEKQQGEIPKLDEDEAKKMEARLENIKKQLDVPAGYTVVMVQTGLSNDTFIEIKSGLSEGQTVLLPDSTASNTAGSMGMMGGFGAMHSGMGGGMPQMGGNRMPSGMSGGNRR